jgi:hypothetical protein
MFHVEQRGSEEGPLTRNPVPAGNSPGARSQSAKDREVLPGHDDPLRNPEAQFDQRLPGPAIVSVLGWRIADHGESGRGEESTGALRGDAGRAERASGQDPTRLPEGTAGEVLRPPMFDLHPLPKAELPASPLEEAAPPQR